MTLSHRATHHCLLYENLNWLPLSEKMRDLLILIWWSESPPASAIKMKLGMVFYSPSPIPSAFISFPPENIAPSIKHCSRSDQLMVNELLELQALPCLVACLSPGTRGSGEANGI